MAGLNPDKERQILPRWRSFDITRRLGELDSEKPTSKTDAYDLSAKVFDWNSQKTVGHAADLVGSAIAIGREDEVSDAARFLLKKGIEISPWITELASSALHTGSSEGNMVKEYPRELEFQELGRSVRVYRSALQSGLVDPIVCADLSRVYASLGLRDQAEKYMNMATYLAPDNRFVLRSASRLWAHLGDIDRAHDVIMRSNRTRYDPWLLATEIATSGALCKTPRFTKIARNMIGDQGHSPGHLSELASGLATLELRAGSIKKSRRLFGLSLADPTENSVAQAAWASRRDSRIKVDSVHLNVPKTFEARSWTCFVKCEWSQVVDECYRWANDQTFSSRPNILGSYVSAVALDDYERSERFAQRGLVVDPDDFVLLNNSAFAKIHLGKTDEAKKDIVRMERVERDDRERVALLATSGLLAFRTGMSEEGKRRYQESVEVAKGVSDELHASALTFFACEMRSSGLDGWQKIVSQALRQLRQTERPLRRLLEGVLSRRAGGA